MSSGHYCDNCAQAYYECVCHLLVLGKPTVGEVPGHGMPDWPVDCVTFKERQAYQRGIADARRLAQPKVPTLDSFFSSPPECFHLNLTGLDKFVNEQLTAAYKGAELVQFSSAQYLIVAYNTSCTANAWSVNIQLRRVR